MGEALEVAKAMVSPCEKLINAVSSAIGKVYEPQHVRKMANAKAYEIQKITDAMRQSSDMPIVYDKGNLAVDTTEYNDLIRRMQSRLAFQEICKQKNLEAVIDNAYGLLESSEPISNDPIDLDWMIRFFNSVEDISNEKMQEMWAKLLAGEIKRPRTFSVRALEVLKNLTQQEADSFSSIAPLVLHCPADKGKTYYDYFLFCTAEKSAYYVDFPIIHTLSDAGLISENNLISVGFTLDPNESELFQSSNMALQVKNISESTIVIACSAYILTTAGAELLPIVNKPIADCKEYLSVCQEIVEAGNPNGLQITIIDNYSEATP